MNLNRVYLRVSVVGVLLHLPFAPPSVERQLLRHIRTIVGIIEEGAEQGTDPVSTAVQTYLGRNGPEIERLRTYLLAYDEDRSLDAYRRLAPGVEELGRLAREHPEFGEDMFLVLWKLMP